MHHPVGRGGEPMSKKQFLTKAGDVLGSLQYTDVYMYIIVYIYIYRYIFMICTVFKYIDVY